jgi:hypothetical protein
MRVITNIKDENLSGWQAQASGMYFAICRRFDRYLSEKIVVSQLEYERNPFYGLSQLIIYSAFF